MTALWGTNQTSFFFHLGPDEILNAIESLGLKPTGRVLQLNSMENRVYEIEIDSKSNNPSDHFKIIKFYRPNRWTIDQINEEHQFLFDLIEEEIPAVAPNKFSNQSLFLDDHTKLNFALFDKFGGRALDELNTDDLEQMGRLLARIHNVGEKNKFKHRLKLNSQNFLEENLNFLESNHIPAHLINSYSNFKKSFLSLIPSLEDNFSYIRTHGDCHAGNIIKRNEMIHFLDFDDSLLAPAVQDIWLILPGRDQETRISRDILLESYSQFRHFNSQELSLIEIFRTFRMINFMAWIAKRYDDPAFKNAFPFFEQPNFWEEKLTDLNDQVHFISNPY